MTSVPAGWRGSRLGERRPVPTDPRGSERGVDPGPARRRGRGGHHDGRRHPDGRGSGRGRASVGGRRRGPRCPGRTRRGLLGGPDRGGRAAGRRRGRRRGRRPSARPFARLDADGGTVTPGLVDPHTHLLFGGSRADEWLMRQRGAGYLEILEAGGGILSTVAATRAATTDELLAHGRRWLDEMLGHGVTTIEAKSGYGLDLETEIRLLDAAYQLGREGPIDIVPTYLGAHAVPPEFRSRPEGTEAYVRSIVEEQLPGVAAHGRARFCDVFCEGGVFDPDQSRRILEAARRVRDGPAAPRRRARPVRRRGAGGRARGVLGRPSRDAVGGGDRGAGGGRHGPAAGRGDRPARHDLVPDEGSRRPGPDLHRARDPGRPRHRLQPGDLTDGQPAPGDDRRLPRAPDDPRRGARGHHDQCGLGRRPRGRGRLARARQERRSRGLARPDLDPDPLLARRGHRRGRSGRSSGGAEAPGRFRGSTRRARFGAGGRPAPLRPACRAIPAGRSWSRPEGSWPSPRASAGWSPRRPSRGRSA